MINFVLFTVIFYICLQVYIQCNLLCNYLNCYKNTSYIICVLSGHFHSLDQTQGRPSNVRSEIGLATRCIAAYEKFQQQLLSDWPRTKNKRGHRHINERCKYPYDNNTGQQQISFNRQKCHYQCKNNTQKRKSMGNGDDRQTFPLQTHLYVPNSSLMDLCVNYFFIYHF